RPGGTAARVGVGAFARHAGAARDRKRQRQSQSRLHGPDSRKGPQTERDATVSRTRRRRNRGRVQWPPMSVSRPRRRSLVTLGFFAAFAIAAFAAFWLLDYYVIDAGHGGPGPLRQLVDFDAETMQNALGSLSQVIAAVLGIAITVVSIVVQLAANRYTSRVTDMFFRDRTNLFVMGFFVVACIEALWVTFGVGKEFVPRGTITV